MKIYKKPNCVKIEKSNKQNKKTKKKKTIVICIKLCVDFIGEKKKENHHPIMCPVVKPVQVPF
jgi:hypothetical protein